MRDRHGDRKREREMVIEKEREIGCEKENMKEREGMINRIPK